MFRLHDDPTHLETHWQHFIARVKQLRQLQRDTRTLKCFISYAWPPINTMDCKALQWRLAEQLKPDLEAAGMTVFLDIGNLRNNIPWYMNTIQECDVILFIGTPRLKSRLAETARPMNNMQYEYDLIQKKCAQNPHCLYPLLFEGDFDSSYPDEIKKIFLIRDCRLSKNIWSTRQDIYFKTLAQPIALGLIPSIYGWEKHPNIFALYKEHYLTFISKLQAVERAAYTSQALIQTAESYVQEGQYREAIDVYQRVSSAYCAPACFRLGILHNEGVHLPNNPILRSSEQALKWFGLGARSGHIKSMQQIAEILAYQTRQSTDPQSLFNEALNWAEQAVYYAEPGKEKVTATVILEKVKRLQATYLAPQGNKEAMVYLAQCLFWGHGGIQVPDLLEDKRKQWEQARQWLLRANIKGHPTSKTLLDEVEQALSTLQNNNDLNNTFKKGC